MTAVRPVALTRAVLLIMLLALVPAASARAAGSPNLSLALNAPSQVLLGGQATVGLTASNPAGQPYGYNLSFRDALPAGVSYVAGSSSYAGGAVPDPTVIVANPGLGTETTTLIWRNVGDLSPNSSGALSYRVAHATVGINAFTVPPGHSSYAHNATAYINTNPVIVPAFTAAGAYTSGATGQDSKAATTTISAIALSIAEGSPEGELLRGAHDHQTVYTLQLDNNSVNTVSGLTIDAYLPAGLEYLRCGQTDNTTSAATNPGSAQEWPGSGALSGLTAAPANCDVPSDVTTLSTDPDGAGPLPTAVYTRVHWTLSSLAASGTHSIRYVAAVPLRENTVTWTGATPTGAGLGQAANLDNNSGARTEDEQLLPTYTSAAGIYTGFAVSASARKDVTAEDLSILKSASQGTIADGQLTRWTLALATGEYRYVDNVRVTDTVPDGLCPLDTTNRESDATADCDPGTAPVAPYTSIAENTDGSWTLGWDSSSDAALTRMLPSSTHQIAFSTRSRPNYQQNGVDGPPVLAGDTWTNTVATLGADFQRCTIQADCGGAFPVRLDPTAGLPAETDVDGTDDLDASSAGQVADGPSIDKLIGSAGGATPVSCAAATYTDGPTGPYGPGDRVCYKLRVAFPGLLDTGDPTVTDFLPPGVTFESMAPTGANTVAVRSFTGAVGATTATWLLGDGAANAANGQVFEVIVSGLITDATAGQTADIKGNLMKFSYENSAGSSFALRDQADFTWAEPQLTLREGVRDINDAPAAGNPANIDGGTVQAGDSVTIRIDVTNAAGNRSAINTTVWEMLPTGVTCAAVSATSGGVCSGTRITWSGVSVASGSSTSLTYDYIVPPGVRPSTTFTHHAGVRSYESDDNTNGTFVYYPAANIDPAVTAGQMNALAADDTTFVATGIPTVTYVSTSDDIGQVGNAAGTANATIGERITYTATATIPAGTTMQDSAGAATFTIPLGIKQTFVTASATFLLNGAALPGGFATSTSGNTVTVTFPANYINTAGSGADVLTVSYQATVDNIAANKRTAGQAITTTATLHYVNDAGAQPTPNSAGATQTIVEPNLTVAKGNNSVGNRVSPGQTVRYTLTVTNPAAIRISAANDVVIVDTLPAGVRPVDAIGNDVADGGSVQPTAGTWNATARTITYTQAVAAVNSSSTFSYDLKVDDPQVGNATKVNNVVATATSYPSASTLYGTERDATTATAQGAAGYRATATNTVQMNGPTLTKAVDAATATIGQQRAYTLDATIPAGLDFYDVTIRDLLPDGLDYEPGSFAATCVGGCDLTATAITPTANADGSTQLGFFVGDVVAEPAIRVVRVTYTAHVDDRYEPEATPVARPNTLTNTAAVHSNRTDVIVGTPATDPGIGAFTDAGVNQTKLVTVIEPTLTIDKDVTGQVLDTDVRNAEPGATFTYTVAVTNTGNATAYDVVVSDQPDAELVGVATSAGVSTTDLTDGWTAGDPDLRWAIASINAGQTVTFTYTAQLDASANLHEADQAINTADVPAYFGRPLAERTANGFDYRAYGTGAYDVTADTVTVSVDLPRIEVDLTNGSAGFPESGPAEVGRDFLWRAVVRNTSPSATAANADLTVRLPKNWTYTAGSQSGGGGEPTITPDAVNGDLLSWTNFVTLAAGANRVVTFNAKPTLAAKTDPGTGNPNIARANVTADDATGAAGSLDGPYADGPDPAQAILLAPDLAITKTPDNGSVTAGTTGTWTVKVDNNGTGTARGVLVTDTIPAGVTYVAGSATSANPGFSESSDTLNGDGTRTIVWTLSNLAAGDTASIAVPVAVAATDNAGTSYTNSATVVADEQPAGPTDTGSFDVITRADLGVVKSVSPTTQNAGATIDFTMLVTNHGPSEARTSTLADTLPAGLTFVSFVPSAPDCIEATNAISCDFGTLAPSATRTVVVRARIAANRTGTLTNTATVATATTDPVGANESDDAQVTVTEQADLRVTKTADPGPVLQDENATFTILVENLGPSDARNVSLADALPSGMTLVSMSGATCDLPTATCDLGTIAAGADKTVTVVARADDAGTLTNVASVTTTADDPVAANDSDDAEVTVDPAVDLAIVKSGAATIVAGATGTYTVQVTNNGPSDATGVVATDTLPAGLSFVSATPGQGACGETAGTVTCTLGAIADGATVTVTIVARAAHSAAEQTLTNSATVAGDQQDPDPSNDADSTNSLIGPSADLAVVKTVSPSAVAQNRDATYTLAVTNSGPSSATNVVLADALPAGLTFVAVDQASGPAAACTTPAVGANGTVSCTLASLASGASLTVTITVHASAGVGDYTNTATVTADEPDADAANNTSSTDLTVGPTADLGVTKTGPPSVNAGDDLTYTITAHNSGPSDATGVTVTDPLPTGLTYVDAVPSQGTCSELAGTVTCTLGAIANGDDATVTLTATAGFSLADQSAINTVTVSGDQNDNDPSDDTATHTVTVGPAADLQLTKTASDHVPAGAQLLYTLDVANAGPQTATGVTITDTLPDGLTFASAQPSQGTCSAVGQDVTCQLGDIASGGGAQVLVAADVALSQEGESIQNTATVGGDQPDPDPANDADDATTAVGPPLTVGSMRVAKVADSPVERLGAAVAFTITVFNDSNKTATGVVSVDQPSTYGDLQSVVPSQGSCSGLRCNLGSMAAGARATIRVVMTATKTGRLQNNVTVTSRQGERNAVDNTAHASVQVTTQRTSFRLTKRAAHRVVKAGRTVWYSIMAKNVGGHAAANVTVCDDPGSQLTFVKAPGARLRKGRACWTFPYWQAGQRRHFRVRARLAGDAHGKVLNRVTLTARNARTARAHAAVRAKAPAQRGGGVTG